MADHPPLRMSIDRSRKLRSWIDVGGAAAMVACVVVIGIASSDRPPPVPDDVCAANATRPRYEQLIADGRITIVAMFGQIDNGGLDNNRDHGAWSFRTFQAALVERGFQPIASEPYRDTARYERVTNGVTIDVDVVGPRSLGRDRDAIGAALGAALPRYDIVYYNGHDFDGALRGLDPPRDGYRIVMLDSCWSTQHYSHRLGASSTVDVIGNTERSVTGSVESFLALLDGLDARAPTWDALLEPMNELATRRADLRRPYLQFVRPEHYRRDIACR
jgi:hypothetical protein